MQGPPRSSQQLRLALKFIELGTELVDEYHCLDQGPESVGLGEQNCPIFRLSIPFPEGCCDT